MKIKDTKTKAKLGEFQKLKITIESEGELSLLVQLLGMTNGKDESSFGLPFNHIYDMHSELISHGGENPDFGPLSFAKTCNM